MTGLGLWVSFDFSQYPPAELGALFREPLEAAEGVTDAAPVMLSHRKVAGHFHMFS